MREMAWMAMAGAPLLLAACQETPPEAGSPAPEERTVEVSPEELARELLIIDTHVDVPYRLLEEMEDISERTEGGDFDHPRAREGGLDAPFMSIYVPASYQESGGARVHADQLIDMVEGFVTRSPDKFALARSPDELEAVVAAGRMALPMGMENGAPLEGDLASLQHFFDRGIRYITLTHSKHNEISDSSYDREPGWGGLSPFGEEVVAEMNRLGIMVDVSHVSDAAFDRVLEISRAPVIATHSSCRRFTPGWERNMSDEMIRRLAAAGGVIHINFGSAFLTEAANRQAREFWEQLQEFLEARGLESDSTEAEAFREEWWEANPRVYATVADVADHIDHVVSLVGVDHVGLGSDFDGVGDSLPVGLKDVSDYPNLLAELLDRGYGREDLEKIASGNLLRVWREVERVAAGL